MQVGNVPLADTMKEYWVVLVKHLYLKSMGAATQRLPKSELKIMAPAGNLASRESSNVNISQAARVRT